MVTAMRNRKKKSRIIKKIDNILEIPKEVSTQIPKLTIIGFEQLLIENYKGILEYEDFFVKISTFIGNVNINGFDLTLNQMTDDDIMINGKIDSIDFEKEVEEDQLTTHNNISFQDLERAE